MLSTLAAMRASKSSSVKFSVPHRLALARIANDEWLGLPLLSRENMTGNIHGLVKNPGDENQSILSGKENDMPPEGGNLAVSEQIFPVSPPLRISCNLSQFLME
jgi:hypothetical protein